MRLLVGNMLAGFSVRDVHWRGVAGGVLSIEAVQQCVGYVGTGWLKWGRYPGSLEILEILRVSSYREVLLKTGVTR